MHNLYRCPGANRDRIDPSYTWDTIYVEDDEVPAMLKAGWHVSIQAAWEARGVVQQAPETPADDAPPTRAEMERKAAELGIKVDRRWGDSTLAARIAEALK
jgi:hypothetical protein